MTDIATPELPEWFAERLWKFFFDEEDIHELIKNQPFSLSILTILKRRISIQWHPWEDFDLNRERKAELEYLLQIWCDCYGVEFFIKRLQKIIPETSDPWLYQLLADDLFSTDAFSRLTNHLDDDERSTKKRLALAKLMLELVVAKTAD